MNVEFLEMNTNKTPDSSLIWLHGLGADGHDFKSLVNDLELPKDLGVRFILPHAPIQPVSINFGHPTRAWFDVLGYDETVVQDEAGIRKSQQSINKLIDKILQTGIASERVVLGGFSQGGALALYVALRYPKRLGGAIGLSTFLPLADSIKIEQGEHNASFPIFLAHGTQDPVVSYRYGQMCHDLLTHLGYKVTWHEYNISHTVCPEEIKDISQWLQQVLNNTSNR